MTRALKAFLKRHWPALRLRTILFAVLFFAAAMPGVGAIFLRVYENTLVRQTQAELVAQGAALVAVAEVSWPGGPGESPLRGSDGYYRPEGLTLDLRSTPVLPERPRASPAALAPDPAAVKAAETLAVVAAQTSRTTLASIVMVDRQAVVILGAERGGSYARVPEVQQALRGQSLSVFRRMGAYRPTYSFEWLSRASALRIHQSRPTIVRGVVVGALLLSPSSRALYRGLYEDRGKIALGIGVIFVCLIFLAGLVSRGVARPIEALSRAARGVAAGQGEIPETPATAAIEIRALYEEFRLMSEAITRRSRYLRDFAGAVSHEFKTPLAGINGAVELLQDHFDEMTEAERRRFLDNISADSARLSQLVRRLLDLARADMARPETGVRLDPLPTLRRIAESQRGDAFRIDLALPPETPPVSAPEAVIETVVNTLLENSLQSGASHARVAVRQEEDQLVIAVQDNGPGVPEADGERLFEPFFTTRRANGGTGLGLSIAQSLLAASQGSIRLAPSASGASFEVRLPISPAAS